MTKEEIHARITVLERDMRVYKGATKALLDDPLEVMFWTAVGRENPDLKGWKDMFVAAFEEHQLLSQQLASLSSNS